LTYKGRLALDLKLHRGPFERLPEEAITFLRDLRSKFYGYRYKSAFGALNKKPASPEQSS